MTWSKIPVEAWDYRGGGASCAVRGAGRLGFIALPGDDHEREQCFTCECA